MLNVLAKLSHEAEQQGTDSIDAGTQWGTGFSGEKPVSASLSSLFALRASERLPVPLQGNE